MHKPRIIFLTGPTAIGKTETALHLAKIINAEIISCDSMQIYKGLDTITSKPPISLRKKIPHHLLDIVLASKEFNVSRYRKEALYKVRRILEKGEVPLFVGGTGLYISAVIDGIFKERVQSKAVRNKLYKQAAVYGTITLYERLKKIDPVAALKIHPHDRRRIVRALEVYETIGQPISELQKKRDGLFDKYDIKIFCLEMDRDKLYKRIDERVEKMFKKGLIAEVKKLLGSKLSKTAYWAIGIKELKGYFKGEYDLEEAKRLIKRNSRRYAKRQLSWFRRDERIKWIKLREQEKPASIAKRIAKLWSAHY